MDAVFQKLIGETLENSVEFDFDEKVFQTAFQRVYSFLVSDTLHLRCLIPLIGLRADVDEIVLEDNIKIRRLNIEELERLLKIEEMSILLLLYNINFCIEVTYKIKKYIEDNKKWSEQASFLFHETDKIVRRILSVLKLIKRGNVGTVGTFGELEELPFGILWWYNRPPLALLSPFNYQLNQEDIDKILIIYQKLRNLPEFLRVPIDRFYSASLKGDPRDKLIDYMIAFEALFSEGPGDHRYKVSLRAARYLGRIPEERNDLFELFKLTYDVRSDIVHGRGKIRKESRNKLKNDIEMIEK